MKLKEKLHLFLERMMMSNHEYLNMKNDAQNFKNVRGCVGVNTSTKYVAPILSGNLHKISPYLSL